MASQRGEGWTALPDRYDDGGHTGANTDRPAFQQLLQDIAAEKIDTVAVYKIDRLSRSLLDFARIMDVFDQHGVSFVSVTQQFNTSTPMGQLMLNILMSFAQFERETIAERTRDKMGATRRRGMWTGGRPVLGYDLQDKKLTVNEQEAEQVREIFRLYLELGSILAVAEELNRRGWRTKTVECKNGKVMQGRAWDKHSVQRLLTSPLYAGKVRYDGELHDGAHDAIIDQEVWDAVQHQLQHNTRNGGGAPGVKSGSLLQGLLRCGVCGTAMTTHAACKGNRQYRSYVCQRYQKEGSAACPGSRVPVRELEQFVVEKIKAIGKDPRLVGETAKAATKGLHAKKPELDKELRRPQKQRERLECEKSNLVGAVADGGKGAEALLPRLGEVESKLQQLQRRCETAKGELAALESQVIDEGDLLQALASFDPIWDALFPREKARILHLLIERVAYDVQAGEVEISFRPGGVRMLARDGKKETA